MISTELQLLGRPELRVDGQRQKLESRKSMALLAILGAESAPVPRHRLADLLWESFPPARAAANLRHALHNLQARLPGLLQLSENVVALAPEIHVDLQAKDSLHRGAFCEGLELKDCAGFESWIAAQRARWRDHAVDGWLARAASLREAGDLAQALEAAHQTLSLDPLSERAHAITILLLRERGDLAAARRQWDQCLRSHLRELGAVPSILACWGPAVNDAGCKIYLLGKPRVLVSGDVVLLPYQKATALLAYLASSGEAVERERLRQLLWPTLDSAKAAANLRHAVHLLRRSLGEAVGAHEEMLWLDRARVWLDLDWIKDSAEPIASVGAFCEGLSVEDSPAFENWLAEQRAYYRKLERPTAPASAAKPNQEGNLPAQLSPMVGGLELLSEAQELLQMGRLLTITGPAGVGKTRLALELGRQAQGEWPGGVWLVELGSLFDPERLLARVSSTLGVGEGPEDPHERLEAVIGPSHTLLLLDNCEHVVSAAAALVARLLERCPNLKVVATSRELLRVPGERVMNHDPLEFPAETNMNPEEIRAYAAVELFVQRASAANPRFAYSSDNAVSIAAICRRLDGLPLAIELAAVRIRALSIEQIARGLSDRFRLLRGGPRTVPQRQQTLEAALAWSYDLLDEEEKAIFRRLCVFAGGFDLQAAAAVCHPEGEADELLEPLTSLIDRSMVRCKDGVHGYRYSMLETVRDFAYKELDRLPEMEQSRARHFALFKLRAQNREVPGVAGLLELEEDHGNFCLALEWGLNARPDEALEMAAALGDYWFYQGHFSEGATYLQRALAERACPKALLWSGRLHQALGEYEQALREFERSAELAEDPLDRARAWNARAQAGYSQGDYSGSSHFAHSALELWQEHGHLRGQVDTLNILATARICLGHDAHPHLLRSAALSRQDDYSWGLSGALYLQGLHDLYQGRYKAALELLGQSLELCRALSNAPRMAACLGNMGLAASALEDHHAGGAYFEQGWALAEASGYRGVQAFLAYGRGYAALRQDRAEEAARHLRESLRILTSIRVREGAELVLLCLAQALGEDPLAVRIRQAALASKQAGGSVVPAYLGFTLSRDSSGPTLSLDEAVHMATR